MRPIDTIPTAVGHCRDLAARSADEQPEVAFDDIRTPTHDVSRPELVMPSGSIGATVSGPASHRTVAMGSVHDRGDIARLDELIAHDTESLAARVP